MSTRSLFHRRDPFWELDGPAARREQRARTFRGAVAFGAALTAVVAAGFAWSVELGVAASLGLRVALPLG